MQQSPFASGSDVARALEDVAWEDTPLGPPSGWSTSLTSTVRIVLTSRFSMWMAWGPELTFLCNDAYRRDTLGAKYPWALGRPAAEVWREIWPDIGPRIAHVMSSGEATWDEGLLLFLERSGYREETYHTFSYSPLTDDDGSVVGMLCVVSEDTERVVGSRRMAVARDLGAHVTALRSEQEVCDAAAGQLDAARQLLPFTATYLLDRDGASATLTASTGGIAGSAVAPQVHVLQDGPAWLGTVLDGATGVLDDLRALDAELPTGGWPDPPAQALVVPFRQQGDAAPLGFLLAGVTPYRPLDAEHRGFVELLASQLGAGLASARAYQDERERAERLEALDRAKTEFFTNVSHEFRTPLTLLLGPAEDALGDAAHPLPPQQRERVEVVQRNGERLLKLVNSLLDFSRIESGAQDARYEPVDLAAYTEELAAAFRGAVERVGLALTVRCEPLPEPVWVDRDMWAKVVLNLLSNALKFTFEGGIDVCLEAGDDAVRLLVRDTGTGIPTAQQGSLFDRFTRVAGAPSRSHEGSGIGLALVADLTAAHGGTVGVDSEPGRGSTFLVTLPRGRAHLPADRLVEPAGAGAPVDRSARGFLAEALRWRASGDPEPAVVPAAAGDRPRVLVVDDNADMREHIARLLAADHEVLLAGDGRQGLALARREAPDLVLSDVMMPHLDGFGLLAALRADPLTAQVPVVLLSARAGEEATVEGLDAGADDYLAKPFSGRELLARVRANLELDRVRRTRSDLERSRSLLDQAQRLAGVGSWELDLRTGAISASSEFVRQLQMTGVDLDEGGLARVFAERVHPDDRQRVQGALEAAQDGAPLDYEVRLVTPDGRTRTYRTLGELERDEQGRPARLRGSNQDVTGQREAEQLVAAAAATAEAAAREHRIADELQNSLLPAADVRAEALEIAAYYRAGVEGTQVGGDWYDVIELGAGRTALVLGDVMGRGVRAAAVMGQLRSAVRAYARLDLAPSDVLEHLDGVVRDLGEDQIVTCVYAVYDPYEMRLTYANAGHLPPLLRRADGAVERLRDTGGPPLGTGPSTVGERSLPLGAGDVLVLYTDGLVEDRHTDIDAGVDGLADAVARLARAVDRELPGRLVEALLPDGPDDDVAVLLAQVGAQTSMPSRRIRVAQDLEQVAAVRHDVAGTLASWGIGRELQDDVLLLLSELLTNGLLYGRAPVEVRLRRGSRSLAVEVHDSATTLPRRMRPRDDDEHGRGLLMVSVVGSRWGVRPTPTGKAVWCLFDLPEASP